ncbi:MAG: hypothetical protein WCR30_02880 [Clostridia bacterium]
MELTKKEIDYALECDKKQLETIFNTSLDMILIKSLKEKKSEQTIITEAKKLGYEENETKKRMQNILSSGILNF